MNSSGTEMRSFGVSGRIGHDSGGFYRRRIYDGKSGRNAGARECNAVGDDTVNRIYGHSSETMSEIPDNSIHLMITSPPYNVGKDYDEDLSLDEYMGMLNRVWRETYRVLVPGGRCCINVANIGRKPYMPLNAMITGAMLDIGYLMRGEIIWDKSASAGVSCAWGSWRSPSNPVLRDTHEYIMVYSKDDFYAGRSDGEPTIERDDFLQWTKSVWSMRAESAKRVGHPAPFPVELPKRLIHLYAYSNDIVLDPFMGSGTTAIACVETGRNYVGYDTSEEYVVMANARIRRHMDRNPQGLHNML